jgi:hypothetical protein
MPEVVDCRGGERALRPLEVELVRTEDVKDRTQVSEMLRLGGAVDQDVIEEDEDAAAEKRLEDVVHQRLEHRWRVGQAERHHQCNTPGVYHQLGSGFELKHDKLGGDDNVKVNLWR